MIVNAGYDNKDTAIRITARTPHYDQGKMRRVAELWIAQHGLDGKDGDETLAYITLEELLDLKDEISTAIQELVA